MATLQLDNVSKSFGNQRVILPLNLDIPDGEFCVLVGPSGCGKSTLLRIIAGLEKVTTGRIYIDDDDVTQGEPADRGIAMVFQSYALYPHMTVERNIGFGLEIAGLPKDEIQQTVRRTAEALQIGHLLNRKPRELSGGQRQRVAIGRAISRDPKLFLLDEPLSNLDAALRVGMRLELIKLKQRLKSTMIYVTHDQTEAMTLADRIVVLNKGKIEQQGSPMELFHNPVNRFVASFIGTPAMNFLRVEQATVGNKDHFILGSHTLTMPLKARARTSNKMYLGVRPEHLSLSPENADYEIRGKVFAVEKMGSESFLYLYANDRELVLKCGEDVEVAIGDTIPVYGKLATSHLFEYGGMRISADRPLGKKTVRPASNQ